MGGGSKGGGGVSIPKPPPIGKSYQQGVDVYLRNNPALLGAEQAARGQYDPQRIAEQQGLQSQFGPTQYSQQLLALNQLDPAFTAVRGQLAHRVSDDLAQGMSLTPSETTQLQQQVRGAQASRGNIYGDSAGMAEAYALGDRGMQLYQQRLQNAAGFAGMPTLATQVGQISPVSADRTAAYVDPNAGFQGLNAANARYGAQAAAAAAQGSGQNSGQSWGSSIGGIIGGVAGTVYGGPLLGSAGYSLGSGLGGSVGSMFSDRRLKKDIERVGTGPRGVALYEFAYKGHTEDAPRYVGAMAQDVQKVDPGAVFKDPTTGYLKVIGEYAPVEVT